MTPPEQGRILVTSSGSETELTAQGWNAFGTMKDDR